MTCYKHRTVSIYHFYHVVHITNVYKMRFAIKNSSVWHHWCHINDIIIFFCFWSTMTFFNQTNLHYYKKISCIDNIYKPGMVHLTMKQKFTGWINARLLYWHYCNLPSSHCYIYICYVRLKEIVQCRDQQHLQASVRCYHVINASTTQISFIKDRSLWM